MERQMTTVDLNALSLSELKQLDRSLKKTIAGFDDRKRTEAIDALEAKAREFGFSLADLTGASRARKRAPASAKYHHPENTDVTWSGRGRKPKWFREALDAGKSLESMLV
jgi:DNA-binding protein H-NS